MLRNANFSPILKNTNLVQIDIGAFRSKEKHSKPLKTQAPQLLFLCTSRPQTSGDSSPKAPWMLTGTDAKGNSSLRRDKGYSSSCFKDPTHGHASPTREADQLCLCCSIKHRSSFFQQPKNLEEE